MRKGRANEAVEYVERLIDVEPDEVEWRLLQALSYELMGQISKAKRLFKEILKEKPLLLRALHGLALAMHKNHEGPAVFDMLNNALEVAHREERVTEERNIKLLIAQMHVVKDAHALFADAKFRVFVAESSKGKVERKLVPILARAAELGDAVDLEDVLLRFTFDSSCKFLIGVDSNSLSDGFPDVPFAIAIEVAEEVLLLRHVFPMWWWKLMRWLNVGQEKMLTRARGTMDAARRQLDKFLRDMVLNFMIAGRDTTGAGLAWFFWLVSKNPHVETKLYEELKARFGEADEQTKVFDAESLRGLVYLHAALCEALRLYPPVPFSHKWAAKADALPSGISVEPGTRILISTYAIGRMEEVWGKDCEEFRPERWITKHGTVKYEPPNKFLAFNAGPRSCLGKDIALTHMMVVAAAMIYNFKVEVVEGHVVEPRISVVLHMKNGFLAKVRKRMDS
ncbi:Cytochrome P450 86B1 [Acorus gramineus]|uniref:Cytochrome P450 86B1 n=1 Tax=Acorus gramineus TaxID=55184 RepID=A0AAV9AMD1_ACOGR|nr:Cytochrome P450 86B1 [Acorus gramineus]